MEITKSTLHEGKGLILRKNVKKDEVVFTLSGKMLDHPTRESIHIGDNKHIYDENGIFINHSFEPTVRIDGYNVVALMDLNDGDEISFNLDVYILKIFLSVNVNCSNNTHIK